MRINVKSQKGAITLIVLVTMLFLMAFLMSLYIRISNKAQTSEETTSEIAKKYNNIGDVDTIYNSYFATEDVIPIYTVEQLKKLGSGEQIEIKQEGKIYTFANDGYYILKNDINLNEGKYTIDNEDGSITFSEDVEEWIPFTESFIGTLDGLGHEIKGLYINDGTETGENKGLFGMTNEETVIKNLGIVDSYIHAYLNVGAIAGENKGTIDNCYNNSEVSGTYSYIGGLTGRNRGRIINSNNRGNIISSYDSSVYSADIGGIAGRSDFIIENCYNIGNISAQGANIGGIVGQLKGNNAMISGCYNMGNINSTYVSNSYSSSIGGIAGQVIGNINSCYNTGKVDGKVDYVGGICGRNANEEGKTISNCYNIGTINGGTGAGVIGLSGAEVKYCYYLDEIAGETFTFQGEIVPIECLAKTEEELKEDSIINLLNTGLETPKWVLDTENKNNGYPILLWQSE